MGVVNYTVIDGEIISENRNGVERDYVPKGYHGTDETIGEKRLPIKITM